MQEQPLDSSATDQTNRVRRRRIKYVQATSSHAERTTTGPSTSAYDLQRATVDVEVEKITACVLGDTTFQKTGLWVGPRRFSGRCPGGYPLTFYQEVRELEAGVMRLTAASCVVTPRRARDTCECFSRFTPLPVHLLHARPGILKETSSDRLWSELSKSMKASKVTGTMFTIVSMYPNCGTSTVVYAF